MSPMMEREKRRLGRRALRTAVFACLLGCVVGLAGGAAVAQEDPSTVMCQELTNVRSAAVPLRDRLLEARDHYLALYEEASQRSLPEMPPGYRRYANRSDRALLAEIRQIGKAVKELNQLIRDLTAAKKEVCP